MMGKWVNSNMEIGVVKEGTRKVFSYKAISSVSIKSVKASCGACTKINMFDSNSILVTFKAEKIPIHLQNKGVKVLSFEKSIKVTYIDGEETFLYFKGKIMK